MMEKMATTSSSVVPKNVNEALKGREVGKTAKKLDSPVAVSLPSRAHAHTQKKRFAEDILLLPGDISTPTRVPGVPQTCFAIAAGNLHSILLCGFGEVGLPVCMSV
jgi:hypothetical protein